MVEIRIQVLTSTVVRVGHGGIRGCRAFWCSAFWVDFLTCHAHDNSISYAVLARGDGGIGGFFWICSPWSEKSEVSLIVLPSVCKRARIGGFCCGIKGRNHIFLCNGDIEFEHGRMHGWSLWNWLRVEESRLRRSCTARQCCDLSAKEWPGSGRVLGLVRD